ncbi:hypothetical protein O181_061349 [Austropuccinia psidii MF-1]|uniref:Integrase catalytic domain-containing protein n=1 Tax=Austropuccinia psidii MF-1 TaxID=1389203 RepID=A0A9Q3I0H2_9BASI|nr:hypothetical protein [Austropuccinia psidii MF-1]
MTTLKIPINNGSVIIQNVAYFNKILGTILSVSRLCTVGVVPIFDNIALSLLVSGFVVITTFKNRCWWLNVLYSKGTNRSVALNPSGDFLKLEMNSISRPATTSLSSREWHYHLGHACNKVVISFLKKHVPVFDPNSWQPFYFKVCATAKSTHCLARVCTNIPKDKPLDLLGPFSNDAQGFHYILTIHNHMLAYSIVYPLRSWSEAPNAILDAIPQFQVWVKIKPKALRTDNAKEFTSETFISSLEKLGVGFFPLLPYSPQENGKKERLNQTLGEMARSMMIQRKMPDRFWHFLYDLACSTHNLLPNSQCMQLSPHQLLFGQPPSITMVYPFGMEAIVHIPMVQQHHKSAPRGTACHLLEPLMSGGWLLWDPTGNQMVRSASVVFPHFQSLRVSATKPQKGLLSHSSNSMMLGQVPMEHYIKQENKAIDSLPLAKNIIIPEHLGKALSGQFKSKWKVACKAELEQILVRDVWEAVNRTKSMKTIGHC